MKDPKPDVGAKAVDGDAPNKLPLDDEVAALANDPNPREPSAVETAPKALIGLEKNSARFRRIRTTGRGKSRSC